MHILRLPYEAVHISRDPGWPEKELSTCSRRYLQKMQEEKENEYPGIKCEGFLIEAISTSQ
jgi:hypothetical protein